MINVCTTCSFFFILDFVKACNGIKNVKQELDLNQIMKMQSENNVKYADFIYYFVSAVVGKTEFKKNCCNSLLSNYASVSDEAFAIFSLENNYDTWMDMGLTNNTKTSNVPQKYTNGGKSQGNVATSQHNKGWSDEGLRRFNELFELVEKNRVSPNAHAFEEEFR